MGPRPGRPRTGLRPQALPTIQSTCDGATAGQVVGNGSMWVLDHIWCRSHGGPPAPNVTQNHDSAVTDSRGQASHGQPCGCRSRCRPICTCDRGRGKVGLRQKQHLVLLAAIGPQPSRRRTGRQVHLHRRRQHPAMGPPTTRVADGPTMPRSRPLLSILRVVRSRAGHGQLAVTVLGDDGEIPAMGPQPGRQRTESPL